MDSSISLGETDPLVSGVQGTTGSNTVNGLPTPPQTPSSNPPISPPGQGKSAWYAMFLVTGLAPAWLTTVLEIRPVQALSFSQLRQTCVSGPSQCIQRKEGCARGDITFEKGRRVRVVGRRNEWTGKTNLLRNWEREFRFFCQGFSSVGNSDICNGGEAPKIIDHLHCSL